MNLTLWLHRAAAARPDAPALMTGTRLDADYAEFAHRAGAIARALREKFDIRAGDRVGLFMTNRTEYLEAMYGLWRAGAAAVPINAKLHPKEAAWIIADSECKLVFVSDDVGAALKNAVDAQMNDRKSTVIEIMCTRELGDPFRRDALSKPVRHLDKYKSFV